MRFAVPLDLPTFVGYDSSAGTYSVIVNQRVTMNPMKRKWEPADVEIFEFYKFGIQSLEEATKTLQDFLTENRLRANGRRLELITET